MNWVVAYKMKEKVRCSPDAVPLLSTAKVAYRTFCGAFMSNGGHRKRGFSSTHTWAEFTPRMGWKSYRIGSDS